MLTYIKINGFKSFHDFEMTFSPFTVIAGTNAAGKSNLFDALKLLSSLAVSDNISDALKDQRGEISELFTKYPDGTEAQSMSFAIEVLLNPEVRDIWGSKEKLKYTRLRYEIELRRITNQYGLEQVVLYSEQLDTIKHDSDKWIKQIPNDLREYYRPKVSSGRRQKPYFYTGTYNDVRSVIIHQDGTSGRKRVIPLINANKTILSSIDSIDFRHILAMKEEMRSWSFIQLNPEDLRLPTQKMSGDDRISPSGKNLAAALYRIKMESEYNLTAISRRFNGFVPEFVSVDVIDDVENKQYVIELKDNDGNTFSSRVLSEGSLRILALCVLMNDSRHTGLLCFEEPENGIHPAKIADMAALLTDLSCKMDIASPISLRQVIVNTHSPVFVEIMAKHLSASWLSMTFIKNQSSIVNVGENRFKVHYSVAYPLPQVALGTLFDYTDKEKISLKMITEYLDTKS